MNLGPRGLVQASHSPRSRLPRVGLGLSPWSAGGFVPRASAVTGPVGNVAAGPPVPAGKGEGWEAVSADGAGSSPGDPGGPRIRRREGGGRWFERWRGRRPVVGRPRSCRDPDAASGSALIRPPERKIARTPSELVRRHRGKVLRHLGPGCRRGSRQGCVSMC
jgi:hypothetical protein